MTASRDTSDNLRGKARLRAEIVEMTETLHQIGVVSDDDLARTTQLMAGRAAAPRSTSMTPEEIVALRRTEGLTRDGFAAYLNVSPSTVSLWERGLRHPTGAALKLLQVVKQNGIAVLG